MSKRTSAECWSSETWPWLLEIASSGETIAVTSGTCFSRSTTSLMTTRNCGSRATCSVLWIRTDSEAGSLKSPLPRIFCARPDSPSPESESSSLFVPIVVPRKTATTTKISQPKNAVFQWPALQRPARPARFVLSTSQLPRRFPGRLTALAADR